MWVNWQGQKWSAPQGTYGKYLGPFSHMVLAPKKHEHQSVEFKTWAGSNITGEKNWYYVLLNVLLKRMDHSLAILLLKWETCWCSPTEMENRKWPNRHQRHETEKVISVQETRWRQVSSFLFTTNLPLKFRNFYKNHQIRVKKIRTLWLHVNHFKKWPHVPLIRCSPKPIRLQRDQKQRCYLRRKHRRKCNINKERYHVSIHAAHMCWVGFFFIQIVCIFRFHVAEQSILLVVRRLFVGGVVCHTYVIFHDSTWRA